MARTKPIHAAFNRGEVSRRALGRVDIERMRLSAEVQENFAPYAVGPMTLRPGTKYIANTAGNAPARYVEFVFANDDTALIELTDGVARVLVNDALVTRNDVDTTVASGDLTTSPVSVSSGLDRDGTSSWGGAGGTTWRQVVKGTDLTAGASCRLVLKSSASGTKSINKVFIQKKASTGTQNFTAMPEQVKFNNGQSECFFSSSNNWTVTSDVIPLAIDGVTDYVVCGYINSSVFSRDNDSKTGWQAYYKAGADDANKVVVTGFSAYANQVAFIDQFITYPTSSADWPTTGTTSGCSATVLGGLMTLTASARGGLAQVKQTLSIATQGVEHAIRFTVTKGPVTVRIGSADGIDDYLAQTELDTGVHSLAFTPELANAYLQIESNDARPKTLTGVQIEAVGTLTLPTPWPQARLADIRTAQSGDIVYVACNGIRPIKIERRGSNSWSIADYVANDGPLFALPSAEGVQLTPSAHYGSGSLTSSRNFFSTDQVGSLFRLFSEGQTRIAVLGGDDTFTDPIRISGVDLARAFTWTPTGTWAGTLMLQASFEDPKDGAGWFDTGSSTIGNAAKYRADSWDNRIVWYRVGFKAGQYTSGSAKITFTGKGAALAGHAGLCRVTGVGSPKEASVDILKDFSSLTSTRSWNEGEWSAANGYPSAVVLHDGRLFWLGGDRAWGSVSDNFTSFDIDVEGDSGPISRNLGAGPVDRIMGALSLTRLVVMRQGSECSIRSSSFDEPLTPTQFVARACSTQGSANVRPLQVDTTGIYIERSNRRVYQLEFKVEGGDYHSSDLTRLNDEIGEAGFVDAAVARQPDTVIYLVRGDGQVACLTYDRDDEVLAWWRIKAAGDGLIEAVAVLPGALEDSVYFCVRRTINGGTVRFTEKLARRDQCRGRAESRLADAHVLYSGASTATMTGGSHLIGETVVAWGFDNADETGRDLGSYTVNGSGQIVLSEAVENCCWGLPYDGRFKSAKLAYGAQEGSALLTKKKIERIGLHLLDSHAQGVEVGQDFDHLQNLPLTEDGSAVAGDKVWQDYDKALAALGGTWDTDSRLCIKASSPRPATIAAVVMQIQTNE